MKRNKQVLKAAAWAMSFAMMVTCVDVPGAALAAKKPKLNKSKAVIRVGKKIRLRVKNAGGKKVKWTSTKKKIASVTKKGVVKGKKAGKTVIKAKVGKKTLKCRVTVRKNNVQASADVYSFAPQTNAPQARTEAISLWLRVIPSVRLRQHRSRVLLHLQNRGYLRERRPVSRPAQHRLQRTFRHRSQLKHRLQRTFRHRSRLIHQIL